MTVNFKNSTALEPLKSRFHDHVRKMQADIIAALTQEDLDLKVIRDEWKREDLHGHPGGGGLSIAINGPIFESGGVNTSLISGQADENFLKTLGVTGGHLWACGISIILHPRNPRVPTIHANFRFIHAGDGEGSKWWFGGGTDLTPYYPHEEDFRFFHRKWKEACDPYECYDAMKKTCDDYFVNAHRKDSDGRGEMRGIGGIFFDYYHTDNAEADLARVMDLSRYFLPSYIPLVQKRKEEKWTDQDEDFQLHRHGRYVEFNLLHDRGTLFGLKTNGRTDSILLSLPARCKFSYCYQPTPGSVHEKMQGYYQPHSWA